MGKGDPPTPSISHLLIHSPLMKEGENILSLCPLVDGPFPSSLAITDNFLPMPLPFLEWRRNEVIICSLLSLPAFALSSEFNIPPCCCIFWRIVLFIVEGGYR